jgi:hypothetical protein
MHLQRPEDNNLWADMRSVPCRGKRQQAVDILQEIAEMDPSLPEYELRPPQVASSHRRSVEHAKMGLVHYYDHRHDHRNADYYRELVMSWRLRSMASVRDLRFACAHCNRPRPCLVPQSFVVNGLCEVSSALCWATGAQDCTCGHNLATDLGRRHHAGWLVPSTHMGRSRRTCCCTFWGISLPFFSHPQQSPEKSVVLGVNSRNVQP